MYLFAESGWVTGLFLAALALTIVILLRRTHRHLSRQPKGGSPLAHLPRPRQEDRGHHLDAPPEVMRWEVQMHETARQLSAQVDNKLGALQTLIADADRAAARLESALAGRCDAGRRDLGRPPEVPPPTQAEALRPAMALDRANVGAGKAASRFSLRHRHQEIYTLADYGLSVAEIAARLGSPVGEIELILGLREKR